MRKAVFLVSICTMKITRFRPLPENPDAAWPHMARCSFGPGNVAIASERYRYILYNDGSEELYDRA